MNFKILLTIEIFFNEILWDFLLKIVNDCIILSNENGKFKVQI